MAKEKKIKDIQDVRDRLEVLYLNMESGMTRAADGKERANVMGKIISTAKLELEQNVFLKNGKPVKFLQIE
jgi:hypothetical protein